MALVSGGFSIKICQLFSSFFYIAGLTQYTYIVGKNKQLFVHRLVFFTCFYKPKIDKFKEHKNEAESIPLTHKYLTAHFYGLVQALQLKMTGLR